MRSLRWMIVMVVAAVVVANSSCTRDMFDLDTAQAINDSVSPVDSLDPHHNWLLTDSRSITVEANAHVDAKWLLILTADPRVEANAEIAAQQLISDGQTVYLSFCYPRLLTTFYAALVDENDRFTVTTFSSDDRKVDFSDPLYVQQAISYAPQPQTFVYCYEQEMPDVVNVDFDYNDVVLNISYQRTGEREVRFHVQLAAVGSDRQMGAAIRLKNFKYSDIESVTTVGGASFNVNNKGEDVPNQMLVVHKEKELLLKCKNYSNGEQAGEEDAVINLFCDAHWATGDLLKENFGLIERKRYNVYKGSADGYLTMVPREVTYIVTFKDGSVLDYLDFDRIDPFIMKDYNGGIFEVHPFRYRNDWVLKEYKLADIYRLPWALVVPYGKFRHPIEGENIGFKKKGALAFGAYGYRGHSFGEWSMDHNLAQDWYLNEYATESFVY